MATVPERVNQYITGAGGYALCDQCIQSALSLSQPQQVQQITSALATTSDFAREVGLCSLCHRKAKVTRRA